jgi:hypothetical protein
LRYSNDDKVVLDRIEQLKEFASLAPNKVEGKKRSQKMKAQTELVMWTRLSSIINRKDDAK